MEKASHLFLQPCPKLLSRDANIAIRLVSHYMTEEKWACLKEREWRRKLSGVGVHARSLILMTPLQRLGVGLM